MDKNYWKVLIKKYGSAKDLDLLPEDENPTLWDSIDEFNYYNKTGGPIKDYWAYDSTCDMKSTYTEEESAAIVQVWSGALVKFAGHVGTDYGLTINPNRMIPNLKMTGAVIEIKTNYKNSWVAQVLWADGSISQENINDLVVVQPPPS